MAEGADSEAAVDLGPLGAMLHHALCRAHAGVMDGLHAALPDKGMGALDFAFEAHVSIAPPRLARLGAWRHGNRPACATTLLACWQGLPRARRWTRR